MPIGHNAGQKQVKRYWPGKVPEWANDDNEEEASLEKAFPRHEEDTTTAAIVRKDDRRLRRLAESRIDNRDEIRADHRRSIRLAEIDSSIEEEGLELEQQEEDDDDVDALVERRRKIKEKNKMLREREEEEEALPQEDEEEEEEEEEEEALPQELATVMEKPGFVPKRERYTIAERERVEAAERDLKEAKKRRLEERRIESKEIVVKEINKKLQKKNMELESNIDEVDADDKAEEYKAWVVREIGRIKRDREVREAMWKVRNMKEEVRREWEMKNPKPSKQKRLYMQKYYHKGAFFQSDPDDQAATVGIDDINIFARDFSAPTGEDKMDKTILPKVMQVKNFGRSGRTKWTHLVNEDTTDWNNPWTYNDPLRAKYNDKMAAMNAPITKPKGSRKLKDWEP